MKLIDDKVIEDLKESLGLKFMSKENRNEILTQILELVGKNAGARIVEGFTKEETEEFNKISPDNLEEMEEFMLKKDPNAREIFAEETEKIKNAMLKAKVRD